MGQRMHHYKSSTSWDKVTNIRTVIRMTEFFTSSIRVLLFVTCISTTSERVLIVRKYCFKANDNLVMQEGDQAKITLNRQILLNERQQLNHYEMYILPNKQ